MSLRICVPKGDPPRLDCWDVPALRVQYPKPDPDPLFRRIVDAISVVFKPQPDPWAPGRLASIGLREETIRDARLLATIDELVGRLSPTVRGAVEQSVNSAAKELTLPQGGSLTNAA